MNLYESIKINEGNYADTVKYRINYDDDLIIIKKNGEVIDKGMVDYLKDNWNDFDDFKFDENRKLYVCNHNGDEYTVEKVLVEAEESMSLEDFEKKLEELGVNSVSPLYYVTGAKDCHSIEQADAYYDSLPDYSSVNYKKDKYDLTEEAFKFIDEHRDLANKSIHNFIDVITSSGPLD